MQEMAIFHLILVPTFSSVFIIVQTPNKSQVKTRTNLEREESVGKLTHRLARGSLIYSATAALQADARFGI